MFKEGMWKSDSIYNAADTINYGTWGAKYYNGSSQGSVPASKEVGDIISCKANMMTGEVIFRNERTNTHLMTHTYEKIKTGKWYFCVQLGNTSGTKVELINGGGGQDFAEKILKNGATYCYSHSVNVPIGNGQTFSMDCEAPGCSYAWCGSGGYFCGTCNGERKQGNCPQCLVKKNMKKLGLSS